MGPRTFIISLLIPVLAGCGMSPLPPQDGQNKTASPQTSAQAPTTSRQVAKTATEPQVIKPTKILDDEHLHNVYKIHEKVLSGGQPYGDSGFKALTDLGVKTVISVDGAKPDLALAKKYGLKYVHLPHGYDGIADDRVRQLAKAVRKLDGPVYIHCHHGKHRSPAAAAVACVAAGFVAPQSALAVLEAAGASRSYRGLYQSAAEARKLDEKLLQALEVDFPEVADVPAMADAMVEVERHHDHLNEIAKNNWRPLPDHPDLAPAHEALMLREHFTELLRLDKVQQQPSAFRELMKQAEQRAQALEDEYHAWEPAQPSGGLKRLHAALQAVNHDCTACHQQFRDVPLQEKQQR